MAYSHDSYTFTGVFEARNITIANNTGGGIVYYYGSMNLTNVLLANNEPNCDFGNEFTVLDRMSSDDTCAGFIEADPGIGALADNGGLTKTHALMPGSPPATLDWIYLPCKLTSATFSAPWTAMEMGWPSGILARSKRNIKPLRYIRLTLLILLLRVRDLHPVSNASLPPGSGLYCMPPLGCSLQTPPTPFWVSARNRRWYSLQFTPKKSAAVRNDTGTLSGDPAFLEVIPFTIITVTPTLTPTVIIAGAYLKMHVKIRVKSLGFRCSSKLSKKIKNLNKVFHLSPHKRIPIPFVPVLDCYWKH